MSFEVEQKFRFDRFESLVERLASLGVRFADPVEQTDCYYAHPARDFAQTDEALRLRRVGARNMLTYKGPKLDATTKTREEIELAVAEGAAGAAQTHALLTALGFRPVAEVCKQRRVGRWRAEHRDIEVSLDEVEGVGKFVELEISTDAADVPVAREQLARAARELGLVHSERRSYLELLLAARGNSQK